MARPTDYTPELAASICERLADGEALKAICIADDMPSKTSVYLWLTRHTEFADMYTRAREDQADTLADEIVAIADDSANDTIVVDGAKRPDTEWINRSRLRVDARKWVAAKLKPKKYGERMDHNVHVNPINVNISLDHD